MVAAAHRIEAEQPDVAGENRVWDFLGASPNRLGQAATQVADCDWEKGLVGYDWRRGPSLAQSDWERQYPTFRPIYTKIETVIVDNEAVELVNAVREATEALLGVPPTDPAGMVEYLIIDLTQMQDLMVDAAFDTVEEMVGNLTASRVVLKIEYKYVQKYRRRFFLLGDQVPDWVEVVAEPIELGVYVLAAPGEKERLTTDADEEFRKADEIFGRTGRMLDMYGRE